VFSPKTCEKLEQFSQKRDFSVKNDKKSKISKKNPSKHQKHVQSAPTCAFIKKRDFLSFLSHMWKVSFFPKRACGKCVFSTCQLWFFGVGTSGRATFPSHPGSSRFIITIEVCSKGEIVREQQKKPDSIHRTLKVPSCECVDNCFARTFHSRAKLE